MNQPTRLLVVTGTRADFGLWLPVLRETQAHTGVEASLLVTAMHLDSRFGLTVDEVRRSGHRIAAEVPCTSEADTRAEMAASLGRALEGMAPVLATEEPDWLLVLGDRGEQLAAALAALHTGTPVAHLHGGEVTRGAVDDTLRDLLSRIAHLHLVANGAAGQRLVGLGEEAWRIHEVGAPGLDLLRTESGGDLAALRERYGLGSHGPYLLLMHHPQTVGQERGVPDVDAILAAVAASGLPALAVYPNADAGGRAMIERLRQAGERLHSVPSLPRDEYATLLAGAAALVGNSSSGIIEAPLLRVPAVNVGDRQAGRTRGDNVLDTPSDPQAIGDAIAHALDPDFRAGLSGRSPYGDGQTAPRVVDLLLSTPVDRRLLTKRMADAGRGDR